MSDLSQNSIKTVFRAVMEKIEDDSAIPKFAVDLWFDECEIVGIDSDAVYLSVTKETHKKSILSHYAKILSKYFSVELGYEPEIKISLRPSEKDDSPSDPFFEADEEISKESEAELIKTYNRMKGNRQFSDDGDSFVNDDDDYNKKEILFKNNNDYTFENYVVGSSNEFAYNAALSIAEKPSSEFNPFFIYGPSGIGKTHLLYAIANRILEKYPEKLILYVKGEEFLNSYVESLKKGTMSYFRQKYRQVDVLLIDDIQFIAGKKETQAEFFHTFNVLYENRKQIILTSDRSPSEMATLEERLRSRFSSGLIQDIQRPDFELRLAILRKKSQNSGLSLTDEMLEFMADKLHSNIREIEGVIKKLSAMQFLNDITITFDVVKEETAKFTKDDEPSEMIVSKVISQTANFFEITVEDILGRKRDKPIQNARNVSMYIIRQLTDMSLPQIGVMFDRKHSSVKSNIDTVKKMMDSDIYFEKKVEEIIKNVRS